MTLNKMEIGIRPHDDGSGYAVEVGLGHDGRLWVRQGGSSITVGCRNECTDLMDAIDKIWAAHDDVRKSLG